MSNRIIDADGDRFSAGCTRRGTYKIGVRSAWAGDPLASSSVRRTPAVGQGSDFAVDSRSAGYLCICHPATGLQVELKQDSNGWFRLRGGGEQGEPDEAGASFPSPLGDDYLETKWHEPADACVWSDGSGQSAADGAGMRIPVASFVQVAQLPPRKVLVDAAAGGGTFKYGFWRLAVSRESLLVTNWHERDSKSEHILVLMPNGSASFSDRDGVEHVLRGQPLLAAPLRKAAFAAGMHTRLGRRSPIHALAPDLVEMVLRHVTSKPPRRVLEQMIRERWAWRQFQSPEDEPPPVEKQRSVEPIEAPPIAPSGEAGEEEEDSEAVIARAVAHFPAGKQKTLTAALRRMQPPQRQRAIERMREQRQEELDSAEAAAAAAAAADSRNDSTRVASLGLVDAAIERGRLAHGTTAEGQVSRGYHYPTDTRADLHSTVNRMQSALVLDQLSDMGFEADAARQALNACGGDVERAVEALVAQRRADGWEGSGHLGVPGRVG